MSTTETAKALFVKLTDGTGNIDLLYGPSYAWARRDILSAIAGRQVTLAACGWTAFRKTMLDLYGITGAGCIAAADRRLREAACPDEYADAE